MDKNVAIYELVDFLTFFEIIVACIISMDNP